MYLVFVSRTKNIKKIVEKLGLSPREVLDISNNPDVIVERDYCLLTYSDFLGEIPEVVKTFLKKNSNFLKSVAGSGNRNFGNNFCGAAKKIRDKYGVPLVAEFELSGDEIGINEFREFLKK